MDNVEIEASNIISKKIMPLINSRDYSHALREIRKFQNVNPSFELRAFECFILLDAKRYSQAIKLGKKYFKLAKNEIEKSNIATVMQLVYHETGNNSMLTKLARTKIKLYNKIISSKNYVKTEKYLAFSNLPIEYFQVGNYSESLRIIQIIIRNLKRRKVDEEQLLSLYNQLARIYFKLDNKKKSIEYKSKVIIGHLRILIKAHNSLEYKNYARNVLNIQIKAISNPEDAVFILKQIKKQLKNSVNGEKLYSLAHKAISKLYDI